MIQENFYGRTKMTTPAPKTHSTGEYMSFLEQRIVELENKLNKDSQAFELECKKAEIESLRTKMNEDSSIKKLKSMVEAVLFGESVTTGRRLDARHAYTELMQKLENATTDSGYSSGYRAGWNNALHTIQNHCVDEHLDE